MYTAPQAELIMLAMAVSTSPVEEEEPIYTYPCG